VSPITLSFIKKAETIPKTYEITVEQAILVAQRHGYSVIKD
jgi:hypothetical protein